MYLDTKGRIKELYNDSSEIFYFYDYTHVEEFYKSINTKLFDYCKNHISELDIPYWGVNIIRTGIPSYIFTKKDIEHLMRNADDRVNNTLVINIYGKAQLIQGNQLSMFYPVRHETWCSGKNYVGKFSNLSDLDSAYHYCLGKWRDYLKTGFGQPKDDYDRIRSRTNLF